MTTLEALAAIYRVVGPQYSRAIGNVDVVFTPVQLVDGRRVTLSDHDAELEAYFADKEVYWRSRGLEIEVRDGKRFLVRAKEKGHVLP